MQSAQRRWQGSRLEREPILRTAVTDLLAMGWSPQQVASRLALEKGCKVISHESIYRFIYSQIKRTKDYSWRHYSRAIFLLKIKNKEAKPILSQLMTLFSCLPKELIKSITFDNGTEFSEHYQLKKLGMKTYFCDVRSPWQKGGVENAIGRLRRPLPRKTDIVKVEDEYLEKIVRFYNHTPRKCLGYKTPAEVFC